MDGIKGIVQDFGCKKRSEKKKMEMESEKNEETRVIHGERSEPNLSWELGFLT